MEEFWASVLLEDEFGADDEDPSTILVRVLKRNTVTLIEKEILFTSRISFIFSFLTAT